MAGGFLSRLVEPAALAMAWAKVRANRGIAGSDGVSIEAFGKALEAQMGRLRAEVLAGQYRPLPLRRLALAKPGGGWRELAIPAVRDRLLQTAFAQALGPLLELQFEPCSYAYRPGRSIRMAVEAVLAHRNGGCPWLVDADIDGYFDAIDHARLLEQLAPHLGDPGALNLVRLWLRAETAGRGTDSRLLRGVAQGSPLSPLLANLYLDPFDEAMLASRQRLVRYSDDFLVLCPSQAEAGAALGRVRAELGNLDLRLNPGKTRIADFRTGFTFLGVHFAEEASHGVVRVAAPWPALLPTHSGKPTMNPSTESPPSLPATEAEPGFGLPADAPPPLLRTLYVASHGSRLGIAGERFVVHPLEGAEQAIPVQQVDSILLFGYAQVSTQAMHFCLKRGIPLALLSEQGAFRGLLHACENRFAACQRGQFAAAEDPAFALRLAAGFVAAKIANSRTVLRRFGRKHGEERVASALAELDALETSAGTAATLDALRGYEGAAARAYFAGWRRLLPPDWGFESREKHPAPDPVNALLDLGYSLLCQNLRGLLAIQGLNPAVGFLHPPRDGHPALASDLMEEFRAMTVDALVFGGLLGGTFGPDDFQRNADAAWPCSLTPPALRRFLEKFEAKMNSPLSHPDEDGRLDYRRVMQRQCRHLAEVIAGRTDYRPISIR